MKIAVIILNYNSIENTKKCIKSFESDKDNSYTFIVVDNNSTENNFEFFENNNYLKINNLEDKNLNDTINKSIFIKLDENYGYSYANNIGLKIAKKIGFKYAIVANPDTEIIDIKNIEKIINKNDIAVLFPKVIGIQNDIQSISFDKNILSTLIYNYFYPAYLIFNKLKKKILIKKSKKSEIIKIDYSIGCFIIFNIEKFEKMGFFDENIFLYGEEQIIYQRAKNNNYNIYYTDKLIIRHNHLYKELTEFVKNEHHKSRVYYYKKYKKYSDKTISILESSSKFREEFYCKLILKIKNMLRGENK